MTTDVFCGIVAWLLASSIAPLEAFADEPRAESQAPEIVREWNFGVEDDADADKWPDGWTRRNDAGYPRYTSISIVQKASSDSELEEVERFRRTIAQWIIAWEQKKLPWEVTPESVPKKLDQFLEKTLLNSFVQFEMDGGAAEINSPIFPVAPEYDYSFSCLAYRDARGYQGAAILRLYDADRKEIASIETPPGDSPGQWERMQASWHADLNAQSQSEPRFAQVILRVAPSSREAIRGTVSFDAIRVMQYPRVLLKVNRSNGIYAPGEEVVVSSLFVRETGRSKAEEARSSGRFSLFDHDGKLVAQQDASFHPHTSEVSPTAVDLTATAPTVVRNFSEWKIRPAEPGYYEVHLAIDTPRTRKKSSFVVMPNMANLKRNVNVGVSFPSLQDLWEPSHASGVPEDQLIEKLSTLNAGNLKLPLSIEEADSPGSPSARISSSPKKLPNPPSDSNPSALRLVRLIDRLQADLLRVVGVIDGNSRSPSYAESLPNQSGSSVANPAEPDTMIQLFSSRLDTFQFGGEYEPQILESARYRYYFAEVANEIGELVQRPGFAAVWNPTNPPPDSAWLNPQSDPTSNIRFSILQIHSDVEFTPNEIDRLQSQLSDRSNDAFSVWTSLTPLEADRYSLAVRVEDLTQRMLQVGGQSAAPNAGRDKKTIGWVIDPLDPKRDLFSLDGSPKALLLPFRVLASRLQGYENQGPLENAGLGPNTYYLKDDVTTLLLHGTQPHEFHGYLGSDLRVTDVWGREVPVTYSSLQTAAGVSAIQSFTKGAWPIWVEGIDETAAQWRKGIKPLTDQIPLRIGQKELLEVEIHNPSSSPVRVTAQAFCKAIQTQPGLLDAGVQSESSSDKTSSELSSVNLSGYQRGTITIPVSVDPYADAGEHAIRYLLTFHSADRDSSVAIEYQTKITVGSTELTALLDYSFEEGDILRVSVELTNQSSAPTGFDCYLFVSGQTRKRAQVAPFVGTAREVFYYPGASRLAGHEIWLQCEQIGGSHVINRRVEITH